MKSSEGHSANANSTGPGALAVQVAGIFIAALVLGVVYNHASPLGVRSGRAVDATVAGALAVLPPKPAITRTRYFNETISMTLETSARVAPPEAASQANVPARPPAIPSLTWAQARPLLAAGKVVLVDARAKANYDAGHIPGALSLPATSSAADGRAFARRFPPSTAFLTYCGSESCHASRRLAESLVRDGGFRNVSDMPGGYAEFLADPSSTPVTGPAPK
jgi:rhodanese-related sulfurtransferase